MGNSTIQQQACRRHSETLASDSRRPTLIIFTGNIVSHKMRLSMVLLAVLVAATLVVANKNKRFRGLKQNKKGYWSCNRRSVEKHLAKRNFALSYKDIACSRIGGKDRLTCTDTEYGLYNAIVRCTSEESNVHRPFGKKASDYLKVLSESTQCNSNGILWSTYVANPDGSDAEFRRSIIPNSGLVAYYVTMYSELIAVDIRTGDVLFRRILEGTSTTAFGTKWPSVTFDGSYLYTQSANAVRSWTLDGKLRWELNSIDYDLGIASAAGEGNGIYSVDNDGNVRRYNSDGGLVWEASECQRGTDYAEAVEGCGNLVLVNYNNGICAFNRYTGDFVYSIDFPELDQNVVATATAIYFGEYSTESVYKYTCDGQEVWQFVGTDRFDNAAVALNPTETAVYAAGDAGILYALDATDGQELWQYALTDEVDADVVLSKDAQFVGVADKSGFVAVVNAADGTPVIEYTTTDDVVDGINFVGNDQIIVGDYDGNLFSICGNFTP
eukprot:m.354309 g.354309  ORF g.354309 m.354309 type:complete len:497 (-) comp16978_c0_seq1:212-1702(-)